MNKGLRKITAYAPLLPLTISYATGIIAGTYIQSIWMLAIMTILAAIATILKRYQAAAWIVAFGLGAINMSTNIPDSAYLDQITDSPRTYRADIANNDNSQSAIIELNEAGVSSANLRPIRRIRAQITIPTFEFDLKIGDIIVFKGQCMPLKSRTDLPDENDMDRYLHKKFIEIRAFIPPEDILEAHLQMFDTYLFIPFLTLCNPEVSNQKRHRSENSLKNYSTAANYHPEQKNS